MAAVAVGIAVAFPMSERPACPPLRIGRSIRAAAAPTAALPTARVRPGRLLFESGRRQVPRDAEANARIAEVGRAGQAVGRAAGGRAVAPGAAAQDAPVAVSARPRLAFGRRIAIVVDPAVGHPFQQVAADIVQAVGVRPERAYRRGPPEAVAVVGERVVPALAAGETVVLAGEVLDDPRGRPVARPQNAYALGSARR